MSVYTQSHVPWSRIAFFLGLICVVFGSVLIYSLNYFALKVEVSPPRIMRNVTQTSDAIAESGTEGEESVAPSPEPEVPEAVPSPAAKPTPHPKPTSTPNPNLRIAGRAALDTLRMLRPLYYFVGVTGVWWLFGVLRRKIPT